MLKNSLDYRVYKTVNNMLYNRGYERRDLSPEIYKEKSNVDLTIFTESRKDYKISRGSIFVFFPNDEKVGVKPIRTYKAEMSTKGSKNGIVITKEGITPFARSEIQSMITDPKEPILIEIFTESELMYDITEHELVPRHELLTKEEKEFLLKELSLKEQQLPKMMSSDPISRYFGLDKGSVVRITRLSETGGFYTGYRIVV